MKWIFLLLIKIYWKIIPENKRRNCLFKETCSRFVYKETIDKGLQGGFVALLSRTKKCRSGYTLYTGNHGIEMKLADGSIIKEDEISPNILDPIYDQISSIQNIV
jgi:putative component of membrane protein insertase Oxa1/YidC/SpoIIIJ protein YidD